jgi:HPr kinase/phosphorylase
MQIHASCAAREGYGVLLLGPSGAGKSDLLLRLLDYGFGLVADDQVCIESGFASAPAALAGLLEVRGLGIFRLPFVHRVPLVLIIELATGLRMPSPAQHSELRLPLVLIDPALCSAPARVALSLDCILERVDQIAGAFT